MMEYLPPLERIEILSERVTALANVAGDYTDDERFAAIWDAIELIQEAKDELYDMGVSVH